jgi:response regulator RpfG family c-di-GMP phosphodiesterase
MLEETKEAQVKILCVDDEQQVRKELDLVFGRAGYHVLTAESGEMGLEILRVEPDLRVIISAQLMPGMQGTEFLRRSRKTHPDAIRIMITGGDDIKIATAAINQGGISKFFQKPVSPPDLLEVIKTELKQQELVFESRQLTARVVRLTDELKERNESLQSKMQEQEKVINRLKRSGTAHLDDIIELIFGFLKMWNPEIADRCMRVAAESERVAERLDLDPQQVKTVEIAAKVHDIGMIGMPNGIWRAPLEGLGQEEVNLLKEHPVLGKEVLSVFPALDDIGMIIGCHHENYDGSGYPYGFARDQIPVAACIIRVVDDEMIFRDGLTPEDAMDRLREGIHTLYEPRILNCYLRVLLEEEMQRGKEQPIPPSDEEKVQPGEKQLISIDELEEGMKLARDLNTIKNTKILPKNTVLSKRQLEMIRQFSGENAPMDIYVFTDTGNV